MAANFKYRISMQPMRSRAMDYLSPFFRLGGFGGLGVERGVLFFKLCLVWRVDCTLFTFHLDSEQLTFQESFSCGAFWGASIFSFFLSDWQIKLAHCGKKSN